LRLRQASWFRKLDNTPEFGGGRPTNALRVHGRVYRRQGCMFEYFAIPTRMLYEGEERDEEYSGKNGEDGQNKSFSPFKSRRHDGNVRKRVVKVVMLQKGDAGFGGLGKVHSQRDIDK
jgi:hypothetical protein